VEKVWPEKGGRLKKKGTWDQGTRRGDKTPKKKSNRKNNGASNIQGNMGKEISPPKKRKEEEEDSLRAA